MNCAGGVHTNIDAHGRCHACGYQTAVGVRLTVKDACDYAAKRRRDSRTFGEAIQDLGFTEAARLLGSRSRLRKR